MAKSSKSSDDMDLNPVFLALKPLLSPYAVGSVKARVDADTRYELYSELDLIDQLGKPRKEMAFASAIVQKKHIGFYFMPIYSHPELIGRIGPHLQKTLKGKSCFNLTRWDAALEQEVKAVLKLGYELYRDVGWVK